MLCGCIDIGTNTTRVLVAEARDGVSPRCSSRRAFTRLGRGLKAGGTISPRGSPRPRGVVAEQRALAERVGAVHVRIVATAVIRRAANRDEFCAAMREHGGVEVCVLDGDEEARLAFLGATRTLGGAAAAGASASSTSAAARRRSPSGRSSGGVEWSASFDFGSGFLADSYLHSDPPAASELEAVRAHAAGVLEGVAPPAVESAVAVGGSAASLRTARRRGARPGDAAAGAARALGGAGRRGRAALRARSRARAAPARRHPRARRRRARPGSAAADRHAAACARACCSTWPGFAQATAKPRRDPSGGGRRITNR